MLRPFAYPVTCCCVLLEVVVAQSLNNGQALSDVQTDATTPNIIGPTMFEVVASVSS